MSSKWRASCYTNLKGGVPPNTPINKIPVLLQASPFSQKMIRQIEGII